MPRLLVKGRTFLPAGSIRRWGRRKEKGGEYLVIKKPDGTWGRYQSHPQRMALEESVEEAKQRQDVVVQQQQKQAAAKRQARKIVGTSRDYETMHSFLPRYGKPDVEAVADVTEEQPERRESAPELEVVRVSVEDPEDRRLIEEAWDVVSDADFPHFLGKTVRGVAIFKGQVVGGVWAKMTHGVFSVDIEVARHIPEHGVRSKLMEFVLEEYEEMREEYGDVLRLCVDKNSASLEKEFGEMGFEVGKVLKNGRVFLEKKEMAKAVADICLSVSWV